MALLKARFQSLSLRIKTWPDVPLSITDSDIVRRDVSWLNGMTVDFLMNPLVKIETFPFGVRKAIVQCSS